MNLPKIPHVHVWKYQEKMSNEVMDYFDCSCKAFVRVILDPHRDPPAPIQVEAGDGKGNRIHVDWKELKHAKNILYQGVAWIIRGI
jgi:hypothetical protein